MPCATEGWLKEEFELTFAIEGQPRKVLTFFALATDSPLYAALPPFLDAGHAPLLHETGGFLEQESSPCASCCQEAGGGREESMAEAKQCLKCCMQSLPQLSGDRGFFSGDEIGSPAHGVAAEEGTAQPKAKGPIPAPHTQAAGVNSGADKKRFQIPQVIELRFQTPLCTAARNTLVSAVSRKTLPGSTSSSKEEKGARELSNRQTQPSSLPPAKDETIQEDTAALQEADAIVDNGLTRTIIIGGAWPPGKPGLPPYAAGKTETCGSFEIAMDPSPHSHLFRLEPTKGTLCVGSQQLIRVSFLPEAATPSK